MTLRLIRAHTNDALWSSCAESFLQELGANPGPTGHSSWMWITHRDQRDALLEMAAECGLRGWLRPPYSFLSELRERFGVTARPIGLLAGRLLVARLAAGHSLRLGLGRAGRERGPARSHMLDAVFSELLPEGVTPAELERALAGLDADDFTRRRNAWVADTYRDFLSDLGARDRYDPRAIHAMAAARIEAGGLGDAIGGARRLHVYGITSLRGRRRLFRALADQSAVEVCVYLPAEEERSEWDDLLEETEGPGEVAQEEERTPPAITVRPARDAIREARWVAREVKRLLAHDRARPHEIAVVTHSGREDTRRAHRALERAGVPSTARIRTVLAEIPALKAAMQPLAGEACGWDYPSLRRVLASPYFNLDIDLRVTDYMATTRRVHGLEAWAAELERARSLLEGEGGWRARKAGVYEDRVEQAVAAFAEFRAAMRAYSGERSEREWIELMLDLLDGGLFDFRRRLCRAVGEQGSERWDLVRLDQRGVRAVEELLREWRGLVADEQTFAAEEWHARLRHLLEANELALSTPLREGVRVLEAHEAALTPFRHTFVIHANDGVFPRAAPRSGVFTEAERDRLREGGLPLTDRGESMRRERTLWRAVTSGASVTITYRNADANGIPRLPSPLVPAHDPGAEIPGVPDPRAGVPDAAADGTGGPAVSPAEFRVREVLRLVRLRSGGEVGPFESADPHALRHAVLTAFAEELRTGGLDHFARALPRIAADEAGSGAEVPPGIGRPLSVRPTPWNGLLRDPEVLAHLGRNFGPDRIWSASQLQQYALRPFDFLVERVLRLGEVVEADEETSPLAFGSVAHRLLERFYTEVAEDLPAAFDERARDIYARVTDEVMRASEADEDQWLGIPALWAVTREKVRKAVAAYLEWELAYLADKGETPILVEYEFGFGDAGGLVVTGEDVAGVPAELLLRGRIDRVDRHGSGSSAVLRVLDYKSSSIPRAGGYKDGALLQSALYMRALELLGEDEAWGGRVGSGVFRAIKKPGKPQNGAALKAAGVDPVLRFALSIPARVRAGRFEAVQAASTGLSDWQVGRAVTRSKAVLASGTRFDAASVESCLT